MTRYEILGLELNEFGFLPLEFWIEWHPRGIRPTNFVVEFFNHIYRDRAEAPRVLDIEVPDWFFGSHGHWTVDDLWGRQYNHLLSELSRIAHTDDAANP
jgi:hypothetical protein